MMAQWFSQHPVAAGCVTFLLMWSDWLLTIWQQRERQTHGADHTRTYPIDTIEGNPLMQAAVARRRVLEPRHLLAALCVSAFVIYGLISLHADWRIPLLGYVWGLFLIVDTTHIGNLIGYRVSRHGIHGQLWLHQRTGYLVQMGRYTALALLLIVLAILSGSSFLAGVAVAAGTTVLRQFVWLSKIPTITADDAPPDT